MQERVAIIQTLDTRDSVSITDLAYLTDRLRETAVKVLPKDRYGVMTTESIVAFLGSMENTVKVCKEASCLAELGRMVSADYVAQGNIGRFGNDLTMKVELYSVKSGILMDSFTGYSKDVYGLLALIDENAPTMFKNMADVYSVKKTTTPTATAPPSTTEYTPPIATAPPPTPVTPPVKLTIMYDGNNISIQEYVQKLIERDIEDTKEDIQKVSFYLSPNDKEHLYEENRKKYAPVWALLNVFYGLGSYIQGNIVGGVTQSVLIIGGAILLNGPILLENDRRNQRTLGGVIIGSAYAIGLIAPFYHQYSYNKTLRETLNVNENISFSIDPLIIPRDGTPAVGLALNLRY